MNLASMGPRSHFGGCEAGQVDSAFALTTLLVASSAILSAFDRNERNHDSARALLTGDGATLVTLDLARYEVVNVAVRAWRAPGSAVALLDAIERIADDGGVVASTGGLLLKAAERAVDCGISTYDAAYVESAGEAGRSLVSCDERDLVSKGLAVLPADGLGDSDSRLANQSGK